MSTTNHIPLADALRHAEATGGIVQVTGPAGAGIEDDLTLATEREHQRTDSPVLTGDAIAEGFRELADLFKAGAFEGRVAFPDQAISVLVIVNTAQDVHDLARWVGTDVEVHGTHTTTAAGLGFGIDPEDLANPTRSGSVCLRVAHVADKDGAK